MNEKNVKVGMKVRPLKKSVGNTLECSVEIEKAEAQGHDYLYVSGYNYEKGCWILSHVRYYKHADRTPNGDYFLAKDFVPYNKK